MSGGPELIDANGGRWFKGLDGVLFPDESCSRPTTSRTTGAADRPSRPCSDDPNPGALMGVCEVGREGRVRRLLAGLCLLTR